MMKKSVGVVFSCILLGALVVGCGAKKTVVGTWDVSTPEKPVGGNSTLTFDADKLTAANEMEIQGQKLTVNMAGTYKVDKEAMTVTFASVSAKSSNAQLQSMIDAGMEARKASALKEASEAMSGTMTWKTNDEFELKVAKGTMTFKRKK